MRADVTREVRRCLQTTISPEAVTDQPGSRVWRVWRTAGGPAVAVKAADGDSPAAVLPMREAAVIRAAGRAAGTVLGSGWLDDGGSWMASPWLEGSTLASHCAWLRTDPTNRTARRRAAAAAAAAARAVAGLHATGWAHGNLQDAHVVHSPQGTRLLNLARAHNPERALAEILTVPYTGALVHLEAPELAHALLEGTPAVPTPAADVYALAGIIWSCCTGTWPVDYETADDAPALGNGSAKRQAVAAGRLHPLTSVAWGDLGELLGQALARSPDDRPSAIKLAIQFDTLAQQGP